MRLKRGTLIKHSGKRSAVVLQEGREDRADPYEGHKLIVPEFGSNPIHLEFIRYSTNAGEIIAHITIEEFYEAVKAEVAKYEVQINNGDRLLADRLLDARRQCCLEHICRQMESFQFPGFDFMMEGAVEKSQPHTGVYVLVYVNKIFHTDEAVLVQAAPRIDEVAVGLAMQSVFHPKGVDRPDHCGYKAWEIPENALPLIDGQKVYRLNPKLSSPKKFKLEKKEVA